MKIRVRYLQVGDRIRYTGDRFIGGEERFIEIEQIKTHRRYSTIKLKGEHWWELYETKKVEIIPKSKTN